LTSSPNVIPSGCPTIRWHFCFVLRGLLAFFFLGQSGHVVQVGLPCAQITPRSLQQLGSDSTGVNADISPDTPHRLRAQSLR
jgi:hypothetical protein